MYRSGVRAYSRAQGFCMRRARNGRKDDLPKESDARAADRTLVRLHALAQSGQGHGQVDPGAAWSKLDDDGGLGHRAPPLSWSMRDVVAEDRKSTRLNSSHVEIS